VLAVKDWRHYLLGKETLFIIISEGK
jgi:hypothetical protein